MGFWRLDQYEDYVARHAGSERVYLLHSRYEVLDDAYPNVMARYDPMPEWMYYSNLIILDVEDRRVAGQNEAHYRVLRHAYATDSELYLRDLASRLRQIGMRRTGLGLLREIAATDKVVRIEPYHGRHLNAAVEPKVLGSIRGTAKGKRIDYRGDDPTLGRGGGADATLVFTPGMWVGAAMAGPGNAPDEVLFHELVHASREMRGVMDAVPVNRGYGNQEEYLAVAITNIYLSEKGQPLFRADHGSGTMARMEALRFLDNPQHVDEAPVTLVENFRSSQPNFYNSLARLPSPPEFNWVRQYDLRRRDDQQRQKGTFTM